MYYLQKKYFAILFHALRTHSMDNQFLFRVKQNVIISTKGHEIFIHFIHPFAICLNISYPALKA